MNIPPTFRSLCLYEGEVDAETVAVCVSLFNYARYIEECLESVAAQDHPKIELVVVDDASEADDSADRAAAWIARRRDRFVRAECLRHVRNQGLAASRNTGFLRSRSACVLVLDADNILYPSALRKLKRALGDERYFAAYSQLHVFGAASGVGEADFWDREFFRQGNYVDAMALIRRAAWERVGGYAHFEVWEDYDFWCACVEAGLEAVFVPEILCGYRVHASSMLRTVDDAVGLAVKTALVLRHPWLDL